MDIFAAIASGDTTVVEAMVAADAGSSRSRNEQGVSAVLWALYVGQSEMGRRLAAVDADRPLDVHELAALDLVADLRSLLDDHPELATSRSADGFTPLHLAAFFGAPGAAALLLARGADVEAVADNEMLVRPLHSATAGGHREIVSLLLQHGADANATQRHGFTPLHAARERGDEVMVASLLAAGADPSVARPESVS